ncbi:MAG: DUF2953 domain-containing protein [Methanobacteriota archaeon]
MAVLISSLLIPAGCIVLIWGVLWLMYQIPLRIELSFYNNQTSCGFFLQIGWGPLSIRIRKAQAGWQIEGIIYNKSLISRPMKQGTTKTEPAEETPEPGNKPPVKDLIRYIPVIRRLLSELIRHISIDTISASIIFGTGDPVTTGCTYGYYHAFRPWITSDTCSITLTPDFNRIIVEGTVEAGVLITTPVGLLIRGGHVLLPEVIEMKRSLYA